MDKDELDLEKLDRVHVSPNNNANIDNSLKNKDLFRQKQIKELEKLRERINNTISEKKKPTKGSR